jgi:hypothetical protein
VPIEAEVYNQRDLTDVEVVLYQTNGTDIEELQDWLNDGPLDGYTTELVGFMSILIIKKDGDALLAMSNGEYLIRTNDGGLFKVGDDLLNVIWTPSV